MPRNVFTVPDIMERLRVLSDEDVRFYSPVPGWDGDVMSWTDSAVLVRLTDGGEAWFPYSRLRTSADGTKIYASAWVLRKNGL